MSYDDAPVLDRLSEKAPLERTAAPNTIVDRDGLIWSIAANIRRILTTRNAVPLSNFGAVEPDITTYGLPDFSGGDPNGEEAPNGLAAAIEKSISVFEPRLNSPRVELLRQSRDEGWPGIAMRVTGRVETARYSADVNFKIDYDWL